MPRPPQKSTTFMPTLAVGDGATEYCGCWAPADDVHGATRRRWTYPGHLARARRLCAATSDRAWWPAGPGPRSGETDGARPSGDGAAPGRAPSCGNRT